MRCTISVQEETHQLLKKLKEHKSHWSFDRCIQEIAKDALKATCFFTGTEFHPEGTVLEDPQGNLVVVHKVVNGRVWFDDGTVLLNGSYRGRRYVKVANSVEECDRRVEQLKECDNKAVQQKECKRCRTDLNFDGIIGDSFDGSSYFDGLGDVGE